MGKALGVRKADADMPYPTQGGAEHLLPPKEKNLIREGTSKATFCLACRLLRDAIGRKEGLLGD